MRSVLAASCFLAASINCKAQDVKILPSTDWHPLSPAQYATPILGLFCLVFLFVQPASAELGETPKQVEARYGIGKDVVAQTPADNAKVYAYHKMSILVEYWKGTSCSEQYQKSDKSAFTEAEAAAILAANVGAATWRQTPQDTWVRTDKAAIAYLAEERKVLVVQLYDYHVEEKKNEEPSSGQ